MLLDLKILRKIDQCLNFCRELRSVRVFLGRLGASWSSWSLLELLGLLGLLERQFQTGFWPLQMGSRRAPDRRQAAQPAQPGPQADQTDSKAAQTDPPGRRDRPLSLPRQVPLPGRQAFQAARTGPHTAQTGHQAVQTGRPNRHSGWSQRVSTSFENVK